MAATQNNTVDVKSDDLFNALLSQLPFATPADLEVSYGSYDEAVQAAQVDGLSEEETLFVRSPFRVIDKKEELLQVPHMIRAVRFGQDADSKRPYAVVYAIAKLPGGDEMVIYTDGSSGIFAQLVRAIQDRKEKGHPTPTQWFNVVNGLSKSDYKLVKDVKTKELRPLDRNDPEGIKIEGSASTFYLG